LFAREKIHFAHREDTVRLADGEKVSDRSDAEQGLLVEERDRGEDAGADCGGGALERGFTKKSSTY
jgi:hypothetical protein